MAQIAFSCNTIICVFRWLVCRTFHPYGLVIGFLVKLEEPAAILAVKLAQRTVQRSVTDAHLARHSHSEGLRRGFLISGSTIEAWQ